MNISEDTSLVFTNEYGEEETFFILEQTRLNGTDYILVADSDEDEAECYIMKDTSADGDETAVYVMVEDEVEAEAVADIFRRIMEDAVIE